MYEEGVGFIQTYICNNEIVWKIAAFRNMLIRVTTVEVCDARDDDSSNAADYPCNISYRVKFIIP